MMQKSKPKHVISPARYFLGVVQCPILAGHDTPAPEILSVWGLCRSFLVAGIFFL